MSKGKIKKFLGKLVGVEVVLSNQRARKFLKKIYKQIKTKDLSNDDNRFESHDNSEIND